MGKRILTTLLLAIVTSILFSLKSADGDPYWWFNASTGEFSGNAKQSATNEIKKYPNLNLTVDWYPGFQDFQYGYDSKTYMSQPVGDVQQVIKIISECQ